MRDEFWDSSALEQQQSQSGLTGLMLAMGAMVSTWTDQEIDEAFRATPLKAERLGLTIIWARRSKANAASSKPSSC